MPERICTACSSPFQVSSRSHRTRCSRHSQGQLKRTPPREARKCAYCPASFEPTGPRHVRCDDCRRRNINSASVPCAGCGTLLPRAPGSLPAGSSTCQPCRRRRHQLILKQVRPVSPRRPRPSPTERGYGYEHRAARRVALSEFVSGDPCARCGDPMFDGDPLDLDHNDDRDGYLGLAHAWCNRSHLPQGTARPEVWGSCCPICGGLVMRPRRQRTCSRPCGAELRRLNQPPEGRRDAA